MKPLHNLIGDKLKISHWDNEVEFTIEHKDKVKKHVVTREITDGEGGFEYDVVLEEKPNKNVFDFDITHKELAFYYQPELTQQEIDEGAQRPDNVVGSYAVYYKSKANHKIGGHNYMAGKVFHIYRPKVIDANGVWVWGELDIKGNKLTVTVPQTFLDIAVYPVTIDPTFGYTTIGGTLTNLALDTVRASQNFSPASSGTVDSISFYIVPQGTFTYKVRGVIYLDSTKALVGNAGTEATASVNFTENQWVTMTMPSNSITGGTNYDISVWLGNSNWNGARYDATTGINLLRNNLTYASTGNPNDPFVTDTSLTDRQYSLYATYTASGGGSSISSSISSSPSSSISSSPSSSISPSTSISSSISTSPSSSVSSSPSTSVSSSISSSPSSSISTSPSSSPSTSISSSVSSSPSTSPSSSPSSSISTSLSSSISTSPSSSVSSSPSISISLSLSSSISSSPSSSISSSVSSSPSASVSPSSSISGSPSPSPSSSPSPEYRIGSITMVQRYYKNQGQFRQRLIRPRQIMR